MLPSKKHLIGYAPGLRKVACSGMLGGAALLNAGSTARAGWAVVNLQPAGATTSQAFGIRLGKEVGVVDGVATQWSGPTNSLTVTNLGPGVAGSTDGVEIAGYVAGGLAPLLWSSPPGAPTNLTPMTPPTTPGGSYIGSYASGVFDGRQSGVSVFSNFQQRAGYWSDAPDPYVDLNPTPTDFSATEGVGFDANSFLEEVGYDYASPGANIHAALWHDDAASFVDLNPATSTASSAYGVYNGKQSGYATFPALGKVAGYWKGTANSFVNLGPTAPGVADSIAYAVNGNDEAGIADFIVGSSVVPHASFWNDTAASWIDLQNFLPMGFTSSQASGIWNNNFGTSFITGYAVDASGNNEAMLWIHTPDVPEPSSFFALIPIAAAVLLGKRKRISTT